MIQDFVLHQAPALLIAIPLLAAFVTPLIARISPAARKIWAMGAMTLTSAIAIILVYLVYTQGTLVYVFGAASPDLALPLDSGGIPIRIIFTIDPMSAFMDLIVAIVGFCVILYTLMSEDRKTGLPYFYTLFLLLIAAIFGMVSTGDLFNFFVFIEISSLASAGLVAFSVEKGRAVKRV
jgi:Membrane bound hydrogenase subunit mbhH